MTDRKDLTRWNRAGRSRFDYIDGNAVEYLEILRQQLVRQFADPDTDLCDWISPPEQIPSNEEEPEEEALVDRQKRLSLRNERLLETYHQDRRDWAWEISRSFARCCHMLTEHANAYANEAFLGTATQWEHVRRLVEMLDYHPAPPSSAYTWLSLTAKDGMSGTVETGFQVKNSPPAGSDKVIFETLEDVVIDAELNELRPKGWDKSEQPLVSSDDSDDDSDSTSLLADIMDDPATSLEGVGSAEAVELNTLADDDIFRIRDFLEMDPDEVELDIDTASLWEWKAKANYLYEFEPEGDWSALAEFLLSQISASSAEELADQSGNTEDMTSDLKQAVEMVEICLDNSRFLELQLSQLLVLQSTEKEFITTEWEVPTKPAVEPGEVAMILDEENDRGAAVTISRVDEQEDEEAPYLEVELLTSKSQKDWIEWARGDALLHYSPRWHKKCWLNGDDVVRTSEAHGLSADSYVGWKTGSYWRFALITETDTRDLRLDYAGEMPSAGTELYLLTPIEDNVTASNFDVVALAGDPDGEVDLDDAITEVPLSTGGTLALDDIFTLTDLSDPDAPGTPPLPPLLPPGALPGIGSFLFPSPFLPIDLVKAAVELMLNLGVMAIPSTGDIVFKGMPFTGILEGLDLDEAADALFDILNELVITTEDDDGDLVETKLVEWADEDPPDYPDAKQALRDFLESVTQEDTPQFQQFDEAYEAMGPMLGLTNGTEAVAEVTESDPEYMFDGYPDRIQKGDWVVTEFSEILCALKISTIEIFTDDDKKETFGLSFDNLPSQPGELEKIHADFRGELVPYNATVNLSPIDPENFELEEVPDGLTVGSQLLITGCGDPYLVKVTGIDDDLITFDQPLCECLAGEMVLSGNVVQAGHGETQPQKIIGSGDATKSNQSFTLEVEEVSFTPDATKTAGVAAAIEVEVESRVWEQVSSLKDSQSDDHHYEVRMTEEGYVEILFGDGSNGRRLPSGKNNIRVRYRVGTGTGGNVAADSLVKAVKPNPLVDSVAQPMTASGGGDMEDLSSLRDNAPPSSLALERAVSLSDFSHLAASQSNIWQASAYSETLYGGKMDQVTVIIVPAGGVFTSDVQSNLETYLQKQSLPAVQVTVESYTSQTVDLNVTIRVDSSAYLPDEIAAAVEEELIAGFALQERTLGEPLYLSEVYKVVEGVEGVENSICILDDNSRVVKAESRNAVVYLDTDAGSTLTVATEEYEP